MRRKHIVMLVVVMFFVWNMLMYFTVVNKTPGAQRGPREMDKLVVLQEQIEKQILENKVILDDLQQRQQKHQQDLAQQRNEVVAQVIPKDGEPNGSKLSEHKLNYGNGNPDDVPLPILMIACDRADAVARSLDLVLKYRPDATRFPVIVSQDCGHQATSNMIQTYVKNHGITHIKQPDLSSISLAVAQRKFLGYYKIARHYKWALNQVFHTFNHSAVIIVEDDLDIAPDFYEYFAASYRVLSKDKSLWCVSAWNDNGKTNMVADEPELLHRTDFFPGLGWMMLRSMWQELGPKWPETFWDDWMRHPDQRKDRSCIRPELSRTSTFGKKGVSKGLFFDKHLKFIQLNSQYVPFTQRDLSYLIKENYDPKFKEHIYGLPEVSAQDVKSNIRPEISEVRVTYSNKAQFKSIAKVLGIMDDFKAGVERTAYMGVVSFSFNGRRVHVAPPSDWKAYDPSWS